MKVNAGLWIDQERALIVIAFPGGEKKLELRSQVAPRPDGTGSARADAQCITSSLLNPFYTEVIGAIRDAEAILIFGPGEARNELRQHLERARLGSKVIGVEVADKMTDPEIGAKVRDHFQSVTFQATPASTRKLDTPSRPAAGSSQSSPSRQEQRS